MLIRPTALILKTKVLLKFARRSEATTKNIPKFYTECLKRMGNIPTETSLCVFSRSWSNNME